MKIKGKITSNGLNLDKCYLGHFKQHSRGDFKQHSSGFSHRSDTFDSANVSGTVTFKSYNSKST